MNRFGKCFDLTTTQFLFDPDVPEYARLIHAIGRANLPGQEGRTIGHAWIEFDGDAYDCVTCTRVAIGCYRHEFNPSYVVQYGKAQALRLWRQTSKPGPWDKKIQKVVEASERERKNRFGDREFRVQEQ